MNEQQLQMTEQKDQEFVKLKLEIQQTIVDKDKTIKEQKQKLKSKFFQCRLQMVGLKLIGIKYLG